MAIDRRKKLLKNLRLVRYETFERVCEQLGITYTFPPEYYRRATRRWLAKKEFCIKVTNKPQVLECLLFLFFSVNSWLLFMVLLLTIVLFFFHLSSGLQGCSETESRAEPEDEAEFKDHRNRGN